MDKRKNFGNILFWATLISPMLSFSLASMIGEVEIFGVAGIIRYSWIMLLFIPIGILSVFIAFKLKAGNQKYKKNFIISFICIPLLVIFGSYRFIFNSVVSYDTNVVSVIEEKINLKIPDEIKVATMPYEATPLYNAYTESYVKIMDKESKNAFEKEVKSNPLWQNALSREIIYLLPTVIQYEALNYDYFIFYNITGAEYNNISEKDDFKFIFILRGDSCERESY